MSLELPRTLKEMEFSRCFVNRLVVNRTGQVLSSTTLLYFLFIIPSSSAVLLWPDRLPSPVNKVVIKVKNDVTNKRLFAIAISLSTWLDLSRPREVMESPNNTCYHGRLK